MKRSLTDYPLAGKRALVRVDFNVPLEKGRVVDDTRIRAALPTIRYLLDQGCSIVLMSHLGRPKGQVADELRMAPVAARLAELLGRPVATADDCVGPAAAQAAAALQPGDVLLLENLRFHAEETGNDAEFARQLASLGDVYVNDAFGTAHRAHASTEGVTHHLPSVAGLLMTKELEVLGRLLRDPARPFVVVLGGLKVSDKIGIIRHMLTIADTVLIGGAMANAFLAAKGYEVGASKGAGDEVTVAGEILAEAGSSHGRLVVPTDVVVAREAAAGAPARVAPADGIAADEMALDVGPQTIDEFVRLLRGAGTIYWNGPMGLFEIAEFAAGTRAVGEAIATAAAVTVAGGGDTVSAVRAFGLEGRLTHVSTGGGASMEFLEGRALPGVEALMDRTVGRDDGGTPSAHGGQLEDVQDAGADQGVLRCVPSARRGRGRPRRAHLPARGRPARGSGVRRRHGRQGRRPDHALRGRGRLHRRDRSGHARRDGRALRDPRPLRAAPVLQRERRRPLQEGESRARRRSLSPSSAAARPSRSARPVRPGAKVGGQLDADLAEISAEELARVAVAYEPIWAIGTGVTATPEQAQETVAFCRARIRERFGDAADGVRILYGGSVKPDNIDQLMAQPDIDGVLVGGASLDPQGFSRIVHFAEPA